MMTTMVTTMIGVRISINNIDNNSDDKAAVTATEAKTAILFMIRFGTGLSQQAPGTWEAI